MGIRYYKPTSAGRRGASVSDFSEITDRKKAPEKSLVVRVKKASGRNFHGKITAHQRGGGSRKMYRVIDFKRLKDGVAAKVAAIEYDPNRTARIALINYVDGEKRYIIAPQGLIVGQTVLSGPEADIKPGNALPLRNIPVGQSIYNIELKLGRGGQLARSAGNSAQLAAKEGDYALIKLPSGEMRKVLIDCYATIGVVSNADHSNIVIGKAGRSRWLGIRPHNRGVTKNPVDHPMGGGEGKSKSGGGRKHPKSPWGQLAKGLKTRHPKNASNKYIVKRRTK